MSDGVTDARLDDASPSKKSTQAKLKAKRRVTMRETLQPARHFTPHCSFLIHLAATEIVWNSEMRL